MFPNSDSTEIQSNETNDCTASRRRRVRRLSVALLAAITLVVGITAAGQLSIAEAAGTVVAVDDAGADDEPGQKDLNWLSIDYGSPGATSLTVKWGWDDTATSGANTRDAGSLFDTDGDGFANYSLYVTVATNGSYTTQLYSCTADSRTDRCAGPALVGTFASTATVAIPADSDPFGVLGSADYDAAHVTGNTCRATTGCYTQDTVATADIRLADFGNPADAFLLNVCSYPSGEPNSDPSDCVFAPNNGFLTIVKVASPNDGTSFPFNASEQSESNDSSWTITGSGSQSLISYGPTTTLDVNEAVPAGWKLDAASCAIQTATPTATGTSTATGVDNLEIRSGLETICTFNDTKTNPLLEVVKSSTTTSITAAGQVVPYRFAVSNKGNVALTGITVTDPKCAAAAVYVSGDTDTDNKLDLSETWIYSCSHTVSQAELDAGGSLSNTVTADSNESGPDTDTLLIPVSQNPLLEVVKSSTTTSITAAGQVVPYRFAVSNKGNVALTGITVTDPKCAAPAVYVSGDTDTDNKLDLSETWIYSCSHTVSQAELDAGGSLSNTVTADSNESGPDTDTLLIPVSQNPLLEVVKSSTTTSITAAGQVVPYRFAVSNKGNVALTGITVTDPKCAAPAVYVSGDTDTDNKLDLSETWIYSCSHTVSQAELDAGGSLSNTVTADSNESGPDTDTLLIPVSQNPLLEVVKSSTTTSITAAGQVVPYRFAVSNKGNVALTGITVTDPKCAAPAVYVSGDTDTDNKLDLSETWIYSCSHTVSQAELDAGGSLSNTVTADSNESGPDTDTLLIPVSQNPLLEVVKSSTTTSITAAGQVVPYRFAVSNKGNVALTGITVTDPKCAAPAVYVSGDTDTDNKLDLSETWIYSCSHTVSQAELDAGGSLSNTVTADSNESGPDTDTLLIPVSQNPALSLAKSATPLTYSTVGQSISYSYLVSNSGNVRLAGPVTVTDDKATVSCPALSDGFLDPGESITCSASYAITQADLNSGSVTNTAKASAGGIDSNEDKATVNAIQRKTLSLDKSALPATYDSVGDLIAYSYLVTNTGNVRLTGPVTVADDKTTVVCPNVNTVGNNDGFLDPAESITCAASYSITQADLNSGSVTNTAKASAGGTDSNEDKATVDAIQHPSLVLDKTASPTSADSVGDVISYTYLVRNDGNVRLAGPVTVADDKATVSCPALSTIGNNDGFLDPGESLTCNASYAITQADLNRGSVTNTAKATAGGTDSNEDKATVTVTPPPPPPPVTPAPPIAIVAAAPVIDLSITKADRPDPVFVGGRLTYTLTVRNLGPDKATNVRVADALPAGTTFLAVATTQGTCTGGRVVRCSLGEVLSGGRATITIIVRPTETGVLLNTATVVGDQSESNTANNRATAPTLVRGPIAPPVASCPAFQVQPRSLSVGQRGVVRVIVTDKGRGVSGVRILVTGPGLNKAAFTNGSGRVAISVRPPRTGIVEIRMTNQPARCSMRRIGVVGVFLPPPVTG